MKIVYFIDHLRPDGTQFVLNHLLQGLSLRGHRQQIVCLNDSFDEQFLSKISSSCDAIYIIGKSRLLSGTGIFKIWRILRKERFEAAVTFLFASDVIGKIIAHRVGVPRIVTSIRARNIVYKPWQNFLIRSTMNLSNVIVLNSTQFMEYVVSEEGADPNRIQVIHNGVDVEEYQSPLTRKVLSAELYISPDVLLIGSVGRLTWQKGYDILIEAVSTLGNGNVHLLLIGDGELRGDLQKLASNLGVSECIHFLGYRRDVPKLLGALDLYIQPSRFEGMPNTLLEAMAAGCAVIATDVDGNKELVEDGVTGWLVPSEDSVSLKSAIINAIQNQELAAHLGNSARQKVSESYSVQIMVDAWERVLANEGNHPI